jgi:hypothetical protein
MMKVRLLAAILTAFFAVGAIATASGCRERQETLGDKVDEAAEEAKDEIDDAT